MTDVHVDLTKNATRQFIRDELLSRLSDDERARVEATVGRAGVPTRTITTLPKCLQRLTRRA